MAQNNRIEQKWDYFDLAIKNGQLKSLQPKIDELKSLSKKENNQASLIKSLFFEAIIKLVTSDESDDVNFVFENFKKEIDGKSKVKDAILSSYVAILYEKYYNENRWVIDSRTNVENQNTNDVRFWTEETMNKTINSYYTKALEPKTDLLKTKISDWKMILSNLREDSKNEELTPTVFDAIAQNYAEYLYRRDKEKAVKIIRELISINHANNNFNAVLFNEFNLLNKNRNEISSNEYLNQKRALTKKYPSAWYTSYILGSLALDLSVLTENKVKNINEIFEIQQLLASQFPQSEEKRVVDDLVKKIKTKDFIIKAENYVVVNQNTPIGIQHKNLDKIYVKVLAYNNGFNSDDELRKLNIYYKNRVTEGQQFINSLKTVDEYVINLKSFEDYLDHSTVVKLNPLKAGRYIILFSTDNKFDIKDTDKINYIDIAATQYALNSLNNKLSVVDRETGKPMSNVAVEFQTNIYSNQKKEKKQLISDKDGLIVFPTEWENIAYRVKDEHAIYTTYNYRNYNNKSNDDIHISTKVFTDRAIYRPGQTVYFKVINYQTILKQSSVLPNKKIDLFVNDVNGKEIYKTTLTTNEFGSANGSFQVPTNVLTGQFDISIENVDEQIGYHSFAVEEYKRPKFQVIVEDNKGVYALNDKIIVEGKAEAFSGAKVDQGKVSYRVYRQEIFTYWPWYRSIPSNRGQKEEITFGEVKTDTDGKFTFDFIAKPASEKRNDEIRVYNYFIEVNVTDINGETQSTSTVVKIGDTRMNVAVLLDDKSSVEKLKTFNVKVTNLNDVKLDGKGSVEIYSVNGPKEVTRSQKFKSDYNFYTREEFKKIFPNEPYGNELDKKSWTTNKKVFESNFDTSISNEIKFNNADKLDEGYYLVKAFVWDGTQKVEVERLIYIANAKKANDVKTLLNVTTDKSSYQPNEVVKIDFKSGAKEAFVYYEVEANEKIIEKGFLQLNKKSYLSIPIKESYRGGIFVNYVLTKYNDHIAGDVTINVPYTNKDLKVTASVLRDKLTPGSLEKWQLKIEGDKKDKISAEVLAAMYDASLDQFASNSLEFGVYNFRNRKVNNSFYLYKSFKTNDSKTIYYKDKFDLYFTEYDGLNFSMFDFSFNQRNINRMMRKNTMSPSVAPMAKMQELEMTVDSSADLNEVVLTAYGIKKEKNSLGIESQKILGDEINSDTNLNNSIDKLNNIQARTNLNETAFFFPNLKTDQDGNVIIEFTSPESLTEWKFMALAHTPDLKTGYLESRIKTQKELMVVPNMPRFLREGDEVKISTKINNLSANALSGSAKLMLFDAFTNQPIENAFGLNQAIKDFSINKEASTEVNWTIKVPKNIQAVTYRVVASAGDFSDGEEAILPILTNRILVTETMPIYIKENQNKTFKLDNLINNKSKTLDHFKLTFEMTANPIWNAIFALPYLREYPYECAEQVFSRLYGNMVSEKIINSNPKIKAVFDQWNAKGELKSKLQLNEELKAIILEETPWIKDAESEEEQMKQIAVLFQMNQMQNEMKAAFEKLSAKQLENGAFAWFDGGYPNEYITTHIVSGFGNLKKMVVNFTSMNIDVNPLIENAIKFIDQENLKRYLEFKKDLKSFKGITYSDGIHYLYARSFFLDQYPMGKDLEEMKNVMLKNLNENKLDLSLQQKAMAALVLNRFGMESAAKHIIISTKETAVLSDEMGMYWKANQPGWFWYSAPVETQAMLIEAYDEVTKDVNAVEEMKVWLLKNKQTNQWNSTKATTKAVYALMNTGKSWIDSEKGLKVSIGSKPFNLEENAQAGSGYVKTTWNRGEISSDLGKVEISKSSPGVAWGAMYWQYFEDLDQVKSAETGIKFNKKLFIKENSTSGPVLKEITTQTKINVGDIVTVRLEISIDRNMEFVHIKDMRASGFEPVNVLSGYKWKGEFGYYESTRDAATNFFSDYMRKGTYVFEYDLKANNAGNFSNGITSMQNMYAPELSAHSEGLRVNIQ